jgi:hypothetical protein
VPPRIIEISVNRQGRVAVAETNERRPVTPRLERMPFMQRVLDNPFLLLFLGVVVPAVLYILWGVMEITQIPLAK